MLPTVQSISTGGEPLTPDIARAIMQRFAAARLYNCYGTTETTGGMLLCGIRENMLNTNRPLPIGRAAAGDTSILVADENGNAVPDDREGELVIVSDYVSMGYRQDPDRTARSFSRNASGTRMFFTGDIVRRDKDGYIYFVGRSGNMVKIGGYRVELEDISVNLQKLPMVKRNAVLTAKDPDGKVSCIVGFVTLNSEYAADTALKNMIAIKKGLAGLIPAYMIPRKIIILKEFPINVNGKIDRKVLQSMI